MRTTIILNDGLGANPITNNELPQKALDVFPARLMFPSRGLGKMLNSIYKKTAVTELDIPTSTSNLVINKIKGFFVSNNAKGDHTHILENYEPITLDISSLADGTYNLDVEIVFKDTYHDQQADWTELIFLINETSTHSYKLCDFTIATSLVQSVSNKTLTQTTIAEAKDITNYTDTGTANNIQLSNNGLGGETLYDGLTVIFTPANTNTGASTLKLKNLDTKPLKNKNGANLSADFLKPTNLYIAIFDGTDWICREVIDRETLNDSLDNKITDSIATTTEAQTGTDDSKLITPKTLHETMLGGVGQSWQAMVIDGTGDNGRSLDTEYTNDTGMPITIIVAVYTTSGGWCKMNIIIDGSSYRVAQSTNNGGGIASSGTAVIPIGATYEIVLEAGHLSDWTEIRETP